MFILKPSRAHNTPWQHHSFQKSFLKLPYTDLQCSKEGNRIHLSFYNAVVQKYRKPNFYFTHRWWSKSSSFYWKCFYYSLFLRYLKKIIKLSLYRLKEVVKIVRSFKNNGLGFNPNSKNKYFSKPFSCFCENNRLKYIFTAWEGATLLKFVELGGFLFLKVSWNEFLRFLRFLRS